ncbi:MAG TPA: DinB family protein [Ilumatobacter sp.]|nr:DinB family protein [Ilumatobacter sp.]
MVPESHKAILHKYLQVGREALLWKLEGVSDYDSRRPMVATGTNLLGVVKHVATVELGYFSDVFGRPSDIEIPWETEDAAPNADMWATADESREYIVDLYRRTWAHTDATIDALELDSPGKVPWWGENGDVTLQLILVHMTAETHRHAGHADLMRELIDDAAGWRDGNSNLPDVDDGWWKTYRAQLQATAAQFRTT